MLVTKDADISVRFHTDDIRAATWRSGTKPRAGSCVRTWEFSRAVGARLGQVAALKRKLVRVI